MTRTFRPGRATAVLPLLLSALCAVPLAGQSAGPRALSLDSRYLPGSYSNSAVGRFGIELIELVTLPAAEIDFSGETGGIGSVLLVAIGSGIFGGPFSLAYHEYGHGTRSAAAGLKPFFAHGEDPSDEAIDEILEARDPVDTFLEFFFESLFHRGTGYTLTSTDRTLFPAMSFEEMRESGWSLNIRAGGMNNEMLFTQMIEDHSYSTRGNLGFLALYFTGKISAWKARYATDMDNILVGYGSLGLDVDGDAVETASLGSLCLSGLTYQFLHAFANTVRGAPIYFEPWSWRGIQVPNTSFFLTSRGLSYRVGSGYRRGEWRFPFAVERVFQGNGATELSLGAEGALPFGDLQLGATLGRRVEVSADVSYRVRDRFALAVGYALYDRRNLHGERLIPSLEHGPAYHDLSVRVSLLY